MTDINEPQRTPLEEAARLAALNAEEEFEEDSFHASQRTFQEGARWQAQHGTPAVSTDRAALEQILRLLETTGYHPSKDTLFAILHKALDQPVGAVAVSAMDSSDAEGQSHDPKSLRQGFMCTTDFEHEVGVALGGVQVFASVVDLKRVNPECSECAISKVELRLVEPLDTQGGGAACP